VSRNWHCQNTSKAAISASTRPSSGGCRLNRSWSEALVRRNGNRSSFPYGPGHYETWAQWRGDRTVEPALRAIVRSYEYKDWPRGRIVFDRARELFLLYADRKLMAPAIIARVKTQFHLPAERTEIQWDFHYQSAERTIVLET
jgi:hypothetical protein